MTQAQIGEKINLSQRAYSYYETGQQTIPPEVLCALALLHGVSVDYLLELTDESRPYPRKGQFHY